MASVNYMVSRFGAEKDALKILRARVDVHMARPTPFAIAELGGRSE